jgi:serine/threonine-protein kinase
VIVVIVRGDGSPTATKLAATDETVPDRPLQPAADVVDQVERGTSTPGPGSQTPLPAESVARSPSRAERAKRVDDVRSTVAPVHRSGKPASSASVPVKAPSAGIDPSSAPGTFSIDSTPYATIYVDGDRRGDTPLWKLQVPPGKHMVRAVLADGREKSFPLDVAPGADVRVGKLAW